MLYYFKARIRTCLKKKKKIIVHQHQAIFICYPTIYDMTMFILTVSLTSHHSTYLSILTVSDIIDNLTLAKHFCTLQYLALYTYTKPLLYHTCYSLIVKSHVHDIWI
jgi:hypothetical protein